MGTTGRRNRYRVVKRQYVRRGKLEASDIWTFLGIGRVDVSSQIIEIIRKIILRIA